jgi:hypothetical protein
MIGLTDLLHPSPAPSLSLSNLKLICLVPDITTGFHTGSVYHDSRSSACDAMSLNYSPMTCYVTDDVIRQEYRCEILKTSYQLH